nr:hypothetical protein [Tanacetum cinerariifolium]
MTMTKKKSQNNKKDVICYNCKKPGHFKRGCHALKKKRDGGNDNKNKDNNFVAMISEAFSLEKKISSWVDSRAFLYDDFAYELWKKICERYSQSNVPLINQIERELINDVQDNLSMTGYFNKMKKFWDELHNLNGMHVFTYGQMNTCTCGNLDKLFEMKSRSKLMHSLMKLNDEFEFVRSQILSMDPLPNEPTAFYAKNTQYKKKENKRGNRNDKRFCTNCQQDGHTSDQCFKRLVILTGIRERRIIRRASNVFGEFDKGMHQDTPFYMKFDNGINVGQYGELDHRMVPAVFQELMKMFKGKNVAHEVFTSYHA